MSGWLRKITLLSFFLGALAQADDADWRRAFQMPVTANETAVIQELMNPLGEAALAGLAAEAGGYRGPLPAQAIAAGFAPGSDLERRRQAVREQLVEVRNALVGARRATTSASVESSAQAVRAAAVELAALANLPKDAAHLQRTQILRQEAVGEYLRIRFAAESIRMKQRKNRTMMNLGFAAGYIPWMHAFIIALFGGAMGDSLGNGEIACGLAGLAAVSFHAVKGFALKKRLEKLRGGPGSAAGSTNVATLERDFCRVALQERQAVRVAELGPRVDVGAGQEPPQAFVRVADAGDQEILFEDAVESLEAKERQVCR